MRAALDDPLTLRARVLPATEIGRLSSLRLLRLIGTEPDAWWRRATRLAAHICGMPNAAVNLIEATEQLSLAAHGYRADPVPREASMCATAILQTSPSFTDDAAHDARWAGNPFVTGEIDRVRGYVAAPLTLTNGHAIGTICAFSRSVTRLSPEQIDAMSDLAAMTVAMLESRERFDDLSLVVNRDPLTGLPNRALLVETVTRAMARFERREANVGVLFVDLDDFEPVNDRFGHAVGDELLRAVAGRLVACVRGTDIVTRPGGDQFVIVCSSASDGTSPWSADRITAAVTRVFETPFELSVGPVKVGGCIGIASAEPGDRPAEVLHRADLAMYSVKRERVRTRSARPGTAAARRLTRDLTT